MLVGDWMSTDVATATEDVSMIKAGRIMRERKIRRLPVVDKDGKLVGIVSERDLKAASPSSATSLDMYEMTYLLSELKVKAIMTKDPVRIRRTDTVERAALIMRDRKFGSLPVVDEADKVVGIITENDLFAAFLDLLGYTTAGTRFVINVQKDHPGILEDVSGLFAAQKINLTNIAVYYTVRGVEVVVLAVGECSYMLDMLKAKGYNVTNMLVKQAEEKTGARE